MMTCPNRVSYHNLRMTYKDRLRIRKSYIDFKVFFVTKYDVFRRSCVCCFDKFHNIVKGSPHMLLSLSKV